LVVVGADAVDRESILRTEAEFDVGRVIPVVPTPATGFRARARRAFDPEFINIHGLAARSVDEAWLLGFQGGFDLIWFFKLRTANLFSNARWIRSVVDIDDVPSRMEATLARTAPSLGGRCRARFRTLQLRQHERNLSRRFTVMSVCSEEDRVGLGSSGPVHVVPNGFPLPAVAPSPLPVSPPRIGFVGLYSYLPNHEGVRWFVDNCWPAIQREVPGVRLRLVGEGSDGTLKPNNSAIDGLGWVDDPSVEIASWSHMIVPLRVGAGTRVKIPDAFSRKCPVVSTTLGALGYDVADGRELRLADTPSAFSAACLALIHDPVGASAMAERAYQAFVSKWTWESIAPRVWETVEDCLRRSDA